MISEPVHNTRHICRYTFVLHQLFFCLGDSLPQAQGAGKGEML